jgi:pimeloyl-ACP methyl ester carboxylesterase
MSMWDELVEALSDRYRVLRYDARGHGGSAAPAAITRLICLSPMPSAFWTRLAWSNATSLAFQWAA